MRRGLRIENVTYVDGGAAGSRGIGRITAFKPSICLAICPKDEPASSARNGRFEEQLETRRQLRLRQRNIDF
jgi:hypothetical protein